MNLVTILGLVAACFTTGSFLPQAIKAIKTKHTKDLSLGMYSVLTTGIVLWLIYGILVNDIPIIASNCVTLVFTSAILILKLKYK